MEDFFSCLLQATLSALLLRLSTYDLGRPVLSDRPGRDRRWNTREGSQILVK